MSSAVQRFFEGPYGRYVLPGVVLQSVLIGGGYATGREIVEFGARYGSLGWIAGIVIFFGFSLMAFLMFEMARQFRAMDYRSLVHKLIGPLWFLYDIVYLMLAVLIISVMAAATGEILNSTLGLNYWVGVSAITIVVGILNFYGEHLIERFKSFGTLILLGAFVFFGILAISAHRAEIGNVFARGDHSFMPDAGLLTVIWSGILYVGYNLAVYPAALFTVKRQTSIKQTFWAGIIAGLLMTMPWFLTYFAIMGFYPNTEVLEATVPWLVMLQGFGPVIIIIFGVVVGWTLIETATGMIHAFIARINQSLQDAGKGNLKRGQNAAIAIATLIASMLLAKVGIIDLIGKGYTAMSYGMIAVFAIPLMVVGFKRIVIEGKR